MCLNVLERFGKLPFLQNFTHKKKNLYNELFFKMLVILHILAQSSSLFHFTLFIKMKNFRRVKKIGFAKFSHIILGLYSDEEISQLFPACISRSYKKIRSCATKNPLP